MLFCAFGFFPRPLCFTPLAPIPSPLALAVAFPSHYPCIPLALSPRIPLAFGFHVQRHPWGVGVSGCRVGAGCRGVWTARGAGCRLWVSALPLPAPLPIAQRLAPLPPLSPPPRGGVLNNLRLQLWQAAGAYQSSDLLSRSALIRLLIYLPLLGKLDNQNSFSWSSLKDIIFWLVSPRLAYFLLVRSVFSSFIVFMRLVVNTEQKRLCSPFVPCLYTSEWSLCSYALELSLLWQR